MAAQRTSPIMAGVLAVIGDAVIPQLTISETIRYRSIQTSSL
jgi:hypothetical protein